MIYGEWFMPVQIHTHQHNRKNKAIGVTTGGNMVPVTVMKNNTSQIYVMDSAKKTGTGQTHSCLIYN